MQANKTPILSGVKLEEAGSSPMVNNTLYRQLIGYFLYLTHTQPDIYYAISVASIYMDHPHDIHWRAAKRILNFVQGTRTHGIFFFCAYSEQVADIFTKVFCEKAFRNLKSLLGIADQAVKHDWWQDFQILFYYPCLREDFPTGFFPLSLVKWTCSM